MIILLGLVGGGLLRGSRARKNREVVVEFRKTGGKLFGKDFARFMHCTAHHALLIVKGVNWGGGE